MILHDKIDVLRGTTSEVVETLAAYVGHSKSDADWEKLGNDFIWVLDEKLRVIVKPNDLSHDKTRYSWHGGTYKQVGEPKIRRRKGRDHHYTLILERSA